jgi:hypothetical protein
MKIAPGVDSMGQVYGLEWASPSASESTSRAKWIKA